MENWLQKNWWIIFGLFALAFVAGYINFYYGYGG